MFLHRCWYTFLDQTRHSALGHAHKIVLITLHVSVVFLPNQHPYNDVIVKPIKRLETHIYKSFDISVENNKSKIDSMFTTGTRWKGFIRQAIGEQLSLGAFRLNISSTQLASCRVLRCIQSINYHEVMKRLVVTPHNFFFC